MMTEEQILQLAENYLTFEKWEDICWKADTLQILNFARAMYDEGYNQSYDDSKISSFEGFHNSLDD